MWFKKFIITLTIKVLTWLNARDYGEFDKIIDKALCKAITALNDILKQLNKDKE